MTPKAFETMVLGFAETEAGTSYGKPSFKIGGKFLTRIRTDDASAVVYVDHIDRRDMLLEVDPEVFHITDHYRSYPIVLARLAKVDKAWLEAALRDRWRKLASKAAVKAFDAKST